MEDDRPSRQRLVFLYSTVPDVNDYRFLFDIVRIFRAVQACGSDTLAVRCYSVIDPSWQPMIYAVIETLNELFSKNSDIKQELDYGQLPSLLPLSSLLGIFKTLT